MLKLSVIIAHMMGFLNHTVPQETVFYHEVSQLTVTTGDGLLIHKDQYAAQWLGVPDYYELL